MCSTAYGLDIFSRWFDFMYLEWTGMIQLNALTGGGSLYFYKVTDAVYCMSGVSV